MQDFKKIELTCFKAYDIRGELGVNLDEDIAYRVGRAFAQFLNPNAEANKAIVVGCDVRPSSESLKAATIEGITDAGTDVLDIGMSGTEEIYFATGFKNAIGGIEVTASHNPLNYNGLKFVRENSKPVGATTGLADIKALAESGEFITPARTGVVSLDIDKTAYIDHLMSYINTDNLKPLKLVINSGNGCAGPVVDELETRLKQADVPIEIIKLHHQPDGSFPNGIPNPMIVANQKSTHDAVIEHGADLGVAFDGDFDRCFFFDETGAFIEGTYVVGMLAQAFLQKFDGESVVYEPRVIYNTEAVIEQNGGKPVMSQSGHSNIKQIMREISAVYGGEMSSHHYFRDFYYCDSGMIPWLLTMELLSTSGKQLSSFVNSMVASYPSSGEINFRLSDKPSDEVIANIKAKYADQNATELTLDGLSLDFGEWRFNLRASNTEPLLRLNVESIGNPQLLDENVADIKQWLIDTQGATIA